MHGVGYNIHVLPVLWCTRTCTFVLASRVWHAYIDELAAREVVFSSKGSKPVVS